MDKKASSYVSRRTVLAGLGTVGAGAALGGAGTLALFNDEETFENNRLVAGELDLKVDWQQLYYGAPEDTIYGSAGMPYVSAFPDSDQDGQQDTIYTRGELSADPTLIGLGENATAAQVEAAYRAQFTNVPDDVQAPIVELGDVKPGDSGCLNYSLHLFDNPAYIWMAGELTEDLENGVNEPESKVADMNAGDVGELGDLIEVCAFYDEDCDCEFDSQGVEGDVDVAIVLDRSGSMTFEPNKFQNAKDGAKLLVDSLGASANIGLVSYNASATRDVELTTDKSAVKTAIDGLSAGGNTDIEEAVLTGQAMLDDGTSPNQIMVFLTNGTPTSGGGEADVLAAAQASKDAGTTIFTIAYGSNANATLLADMASEPESTYAYLAADIAAVEAIFAQIGEIISGERKIFEGTLKEFLAAAATGIPLDGNRGTAPQVVSDGDGGMALEGWDCFPNSTTACIGLHWELPVEVGNEVQSDSIAFDVSFYAEQCRHNDGEINPYGGPSATEFFTA